MPTTPNRGYPYQADTDLPNGAALGKDLAEAVDLDVATLAADLGGNGYRYLTSVYYTATSSFDHGDYPGCRAVIVEVGGAGGGSGGAAATAAGQGAVGGGGGEGGYARKFIPVGLLAASETVTIGAGGAAATAGANPGGTGGTTSFGSHVSATGGTGGTGGTAGGTDTIIGGGDGGVGSGGDINLEGSPGDFGMRVGQTPVRLSNGGYGSTPWSHGVRPTGAGNGGNGSNGGGWCGGATGAVNPQGQVSRTGGTGAGGRCEVHVYI